MLATMQLKEGISTEKEIWQQPEMWLKEHEFISKEKEHIRSFLSGHSFSKQSEIILTGAGTSAFIGNILECILPQKGYTNCRAVATTDLITHPKTYLNNDREIFMVSFARSGNSPESLAAVKLADTFAKKVVHIVITCNADGELATRANPDNTLMLLLPPETNDKSLAMTSSFSTMLLAFLLLINIDDTDNTQKQIDALSKHAAQTLGVYARLIEKIAQIDFHRAVFLGSGELKGIAEECHLKLQELTDGKVICKFDSFLGFRHGPKAVIDDNTLLVYLFSDDEHSRRYEKDLVKQINTGNQGIAQIGVSGGDTPEIEGFRPDLEMVLHSSRKNTGEFACIPYVLIGQLLGFYKSLALGLDPDNPSVSGKISRVVEGVKIYDVE